MLGKPYSLRTNMSKKVPDNIRGIGKIFNLFLITFENRIAKPLYKVLRAPIMNILS